MRSWVIRYVSYLVVALDHRPIRPIFKFISWAIIRLFTRKIYSSSRIHSFYVIREFPKGDEFYGLSDVDFLIVTQDRASKDNAVRLYERLARWIPLIDPVHAICEKSELLDLCQKYEIYRFRCGEECSNWVLLHGYDMRNELINTGDFSLREGLIAEAGRMWDYLIKHVFSSTDLIPMRENYLFYKVISTLAILKKFDTTKRLLSRRDVFNEAKDNFREFYPEFLQINRLIKFPYIFYRQRNLLNNAFDASLKILDTWSASKPLVEPSRKKAARIHINLESFLKWTSESEEIRRVEILISGTLGEKVTIMKVPRFFDPRLYALTAPRVAHESLFSDPLSFLGLDGANFFVVYQDEIGLNQVKSLKNTLPSSDERFGVYIWKNNLGFRVNDFAVTWDASPAVRFMDFNLLTFQCLNHLLKNSVSFEFDTCEESWERIERKNKLDRDEIWKILKNHDLTLLKSSHSLLKFLCYGVHLHCLKVSASSELITLPVSIEDTYHWLIEEERGDPAFLTEFFEEACLNESRPVTAQSRIFENVFRIMKKILFN